MSTSKPKRVDTLTGSLLGMAVGDALGLPYENLSRRRLQKLLGPPSRYRFLFGRGMVSDDTEHACLVAQAIIQSPGDPVEFQRALARRLKHWFWMLPAGIGLATLRSMMKLSVGITPEKSGVFSAGNGPAMRAPLLGVAIDDLAMMKEMVRRSTRITHTDPKAFYGAAAVALAARISARSESITPSEYLEQLTEFLNGEPADEFLDLVRRVVESVQLGNSTSKYCEQHEMAQGVSGYIYQTVPVVLHCWFLHCEEYEEGIQEIIQLGGDTDTTAAILGGSIGARVGVGGIPDHLLVNLSEFPRKVDWMKRLTTQLEEVLTTNQSERPLSVSPFLVLLRNVLFIVVVLFHGFRRLLPPW
ncbi:ADP-ribosylglycohydrolase [Polystyrenella longa]|uniref:ADP-ribosylglycohydrolase n=1 Tax=Polystyrenella longa TaxID=2528007 RepID=A0A518CM37_9PLAN|nr:ADP-ribosylglycohydrolase family protein [Polystyrenella longa]QDU80285.1 ADP-ribosylglycohydrolase [Polystyrenella longa]